MDSVTLVKTLSVVMLILTILVGNVLEIRKKKEIFVQFLKYIWTVVLFSFLSSGVVSSIQLLISTAAGNWLQENAMCQLFGFLNLVLNSGSVWVMAIAALERYCRFVMPSEHSSTFSRRNLNLMIAGVYILVTLVATGPLYGLGEYSNLRGHLALIVNGTIVSHNESAPQYGNYGSEEDVIRLYVQILRNMAAGMPQLNPAVAIQNYLESDVGINVRSPSWVEKGMVFIVRAPNLHVAESLWQHVKDGDLNTVINKNILNLNISMYIGRDDVRFYSCIDEQEYLTYRDIYIPSQEIGLCTVDFTSVNVHAIVWCVYQLVVTKGFPFIVILVTYTILFLRNPYIMSARDTTLNEEELWSLKLFCSSSMLCCFLATVYYAVTLCNAYGAYISNDTIFAVTFLYYCSGMTLFVLDKMIESTVFSKIHTRISKCWNASKTSITQELAELSIRRESLPKTLRRVTITKPTNL